MKERSFKSPLNAAGIWAIIISLLVVLTLFQLAAVLAQTVFHTTLTQSMFYNLLTYLGVMLAPIYAFERFFLKSRGERLSFNLELPKKMTWLLFFVLMSGGIIVAEFFTVMVPTEGGWLGEMYQMMEQQILFLSKDPAAIVVMTVGFAPLLEEILFRGIVMRGLLNKGTKPLYAIVFSALAFGIFHFNPWQLVAGFILGLILGYSYYKTRSLLVPILLHAFNNLISSYLILTGEMDTYAKSFETEAWVLLGFGILISVASYYFIEKSFNKSETQFNED